MDTSSIEISAEMLKKDNLKYMRGFAMLAWMLQQYLEDAALENERDLRRRIRSGV